MSRFIVDPRRRGPHCPGFETLIMWQQPGFMELASYQGFQSNVQALYDNMASIALTFSGSGFSQFRVIFNEPKKIDCIGFAGCNWSATSSFSVEGYVPAEDDIRVLDDTSFAGLQDNQPLLIEIDNEFEYSEIHLHIYRDSTFRIGEMAPGIALRMPSPSTGFQLAQWNWKDKITHSMTEGNQIGSSTISPMGNEQSMKFPFLPLSFMQTKWKQFVEQSHGRPIWCSWNINNLPKECIYGLWDQRPPKYGALSEVDMTIRGAAQ